VGKIVGKKDLAKELGWSRMKLERRLRDDAKFPVEAIGDQTGGWKFDVAAVERYLSGKLPPQQPAIDKAQLRDVVKPPQRSLPGHRGASARRSAHHEGEASARQRKDLADAQLKENKVRLENGELVETSEVRQTMNEIFAGIGNDLEALPEEVAKRLGLDDPDAAAATVQTLIDDMRTAMVRRLSVLLQET
jgi:phage terminase Nu1 subunit (DNA packaging protein)